MSDAAITLTSPSILNVDHNVSTQFSAESLTYAQLVERHGQANVDNAIQNATQQNLAGELHTQIDGSEPPLPEAVAQDAHNTVDQGVDILPTTSAAQSDVDDMLADGMVYANIAEMADEASEEAGGVGGGKGSKNWLVLMMSVLSKIAGTHLKNAIDYAEQIGDIGDSKDTDAAAMREWEAAGSEGTAPASTLGTQAEHTAELQGKMQAEMQLFKMVFEAAASLGKTVGQGFQTMSRNQ